MHRVVETWHPGNLGWAQARASSPAAFSALRRDTAAAAARAVASRPLTLVQPLRAGAAAVAARRAAGAALRVPARAAAGDAAQAAGDAAHAAGDADAGAAAAAAEAALVAHTARVADLALQHAAALNLRTLPAVRTDAGGNASDAADAVYAHVLAAAVAPMLRKQLVPNLFASLADAAALLRTAASLDARLRTPEVCAFMRTVSELEASASSAAAEPRTGGAALPPPLAAGRAVVVEGLDGTGKSTLVASLAASLRAHAARTPPASLTPLRALFDAMPAPVTRAFYTCGNYVAAHEMARAAADGRATVVRSCARCSLAPSLPLASRSAFCQRRRAVLAPSHSADVRAARGLPHRRWTGSIIQLPRTPLAPRRLPPAATPHHSRRCLRMRLRGRRTCLLRRWCCCCAWRTARAPRGCGRAAPRGGAPRRRRSARMRRSRSASTMRTSLCARRLAAAWWRWTRAPAQRRCAPRRAPRARQRGCEARRLVG
jgi:hypothetical protein